MPASEMSGLQRPVSRRTLLRTAAWSAPVIAVAVAAPAAAASTPVPRSAMTIKFNNFTQHNGHLGNAKIEFPYVNWQNTVYMQKIVLVITGPASVYSAVATIAGQGWTLTKCTTVGSDREYTFTYERAQPTLTQAQSTEKLDFDLGLVGTSGGTVTAKAYGLDSNGNFTYVVTPTN